MLSFDILFLISTVLNLAAGTPVLTRGHNDTLPRTIKWEDCGLDSTDPLNNTTPVLCGTLAVPLDYTDSYGGKTIQLNLLKVPAAANKTRRGSVFTNAGGPGINNTEWMTGFGTQLRTVVGDDHDIVSWHPRGTEGTLLFSCYANDTIRQLANIQFPTLVGTVKTDSSNTAPGQVWAESALFDNECGKAQKATGDLVGTAFTVRDMFQIVDALQEDGLLRYWGFSYGTVLGATAAAMFPERIDKIVLDGVVNPLDYYSRDIVLSVPESADASLAGFAKGCVGAPDLCPIAGNRTAGQLEEYIYSSLEDLKFNPIPLNVPPSLVTYGLAKSIIFQSLYTPSDWVGFGELLFPLLTRNVSALEAIVTSLTGQTPEVDDEAIQGIKCSDVSQRVPSLQGLLPEIEANHNLSRIAGDVSDLVAIQCAQWPFKAKERYTGDFRVKTAKPALIIGNTYDPATPLSSARNVSAGFEGSALLQQDGYGHSSAAQASLCTSKAIRAYFSNGILPAPGTVCKVDQPLLPADPNAGWVQVLRQLG